MITTVLGGEGVGEGGQYNWTLLQQMNTEWKVLFGILSTPTGELLQHLSLDGGGGGGGGISITATYCSKRMLQ